MAVALMQHENMTVLAEIKGADLPLDQPLYNHYPAMKLGHQPEVEFYAKQLYGNCKTLLMNNKNKQWAITAPAYYQLPAAANLLARNVHHKLTHDGYKIALVEPRISGQQATINNQQEFNSYYHYSKNDQVARIRERERVQKMLDHDHLTPQLRNRSVIVINDINVTGTQQKFIQSSLTQCQAQDCHWFYIFTIDKSFAANNPEIEYQLNHCQIKDIASFGQILSDRKTEHTARSISRLFDLEMADFQQLIASLDQNVTRRLYNLACQEGRYGGAFFAPKMQLLTSDISEITK